MPDTEATGFVGVETYRKKPVDVEVVQFQGTPPDATNATQIIEWILSKDGNARAHLEDDDDIAIYIDTLEGTMRANLGDWIVLGTHGEFYPIKGDIFAVNYERVEG